jgi:3-hydroxyacyl-[acyl-carrier-protein] dehydratase
MPPTLLFDLNSIDLQAEPVIDRAGVEASNPQRYEMQQLDGILWIDKPKKLILGYKDVTDHEFWIRGHIPGRPLMPGVIMVECAAQLLSFFVRHLQEESKFIGFGGIESAKFRATVEPGQRLLLLGHIFEMKSRRFRCSVQGVVDNTLVFEAKVAGVRL